MIAKEAFEIVIGVIEEEVHARSLDIWESPIDDKELSDKAFRAADCEFINQRGRNIIFNFITGMSVSQYINQRVLMRAYQVLLQEEQYDLSPLINITGLSAEPSLYKKFKDCFKMTPKEAYERKIEFLYIPPYEWEKISSEGHTFFHDAIKVNKGVPVIVKKYDKRAYIIVASIIIGLSLLIGSFSILYKFLYPWLGEFVISVNGVNNENGEMISVLQNDALVHFNLINRKIEVTVKDQRLEYVIDSIEFGEILYHEPITNKGGEWSAKYLEEDKSIYLIPESIPYSDYYGYSIWSFCIKRRDLYEKCKKNWDGFYAVYYSDTKEDKLTDTKLSLSISIDAGLVMLISDDTLETSIMPIGTRSEDTITTLNGVTFLKKWGTVYFESDNSDGGQVSYFEAKKID